MTLAAIPLTQRFGRRITITAFSFLLCIGSVLQVVQSHSLSCFYVGRLIAGFGVGPLAFIVPMYAAEVSPAGSRARIGSIYSLFLVVGKCSKVSFPETLFL